MTNILIIGGAGFIGSYLSENLANTYSHITIIDDLSTGNLENIKHMLKLKNVTFFKDNFLNMDFNNKFDEIYNMAARVNARNENPKDFMLNVNIVEKSIKLLKENGKYHFASSCAVYGNNRNALEDDKLNPLTQYAYSKYISEELIKQSVNNYFIYRFSNVFGERQDGSKEAGIVAIILKNILNNSTVEIYNKGKTKRDYIYVQDLIYAMIIEKNVGIYNIGTNKLYKTLDIVKHSGVKYFLGKNIKEPKIVKLNNKKIIEKSNNNWKPTLNVLDYLNKYL